MFTFRKVAYRFAVVLSIIILIYLLTTFRTRSVNSSSVEYSALIIEFRSHPQLVRTVLNVLNFIPATWPLQLVYGHENLAYIHKSPILRKYITSKRLITTLLETTLTNNTDSQQIMNHLMTSKEFWQNVIINSKKVLYVQLDSTFCSNSPHHITDFLQYDYIGAPWESCQIGNGGFSWRSKKKSLQLLEKLPYLGFSVHQNEDQYFGSNLYLVKGNMPSCQVAAQFAAECHYSAHRIPMAVHKPHMNGTMYRLLLEYCPEVEMIPFYQKMDKDGTYSSYTAFENAPYNQRYFSRS